MSVSSATPELSPAAGSTTLPDPVAAVMHRFEHCQARFETAAARIELAKQLASRGWSEQAAREATAALQVLAALSRELSPRPTPPSSDHGLPDLEALTTRERQILALLAEGLTNRQIGRRLQLSEHTARHHVGSILRKLGLRSRAAAAAAYAATSGRAGLAAPLG